MKFPDWTKKQYYIALGILLLVAVGFGWLFGYEATIVFQGEFWAILLKMLWNILAMLLGFVGVLGCGYLGYLVYKNKLSSIK